MSATIPQFSSYSPDREQRSWGAALFTSAVIYAVVGVTVVVLGKATHDVFVEKPPELTFTETIAKVEAPPPPPPVVEAQPAPPPPVAAPVVPKNMKIRKLDAPPPPKELVAPKELPKASPQEADPSQDKGVAVYGEPGTGDPAGLEGGVAGATASGNANAIAVPEDADPPTPLKSNAPPPYPQEARAAGKTGDVILKVVIRADGSVADVQVQRGDEPFASAAVAAVKLWKYEPARYKGQAITVYTMIRIPFKLTV